MYKNMLMLLGGILLLVIGLTIATNKPDPQIQTFEECAAAGYPIGESYPRQCWTPQGGHFVEEITEPTPEPDDSPVSGEAPAGCAVAGCSGQICTDADRARDLVTTCEYRAEYGCYKTARCERQASGACGWTETAELAACLRSAQDSPESMPQ